MQIFIITTCILLLLALQPAVGFGLSNNTSPFVPIYHQLSPSSHSQYLKIFFYFFSPSFPRSSSSSRPFQFLSEDLFGHPILHSLQVTQPTIPLPLYPFSYNFSLLNPSSSWFVLIFHSPFSYLGQYILLNIFLSKLTLKFTLKCCYMFRLTNYHQGAYCRALLKL